ARWAGIGVALSPVLFVISGYHGNTDPLFCALLVLGAYLLVDLRRAATAGAVAALAVGIKLVAVVAVPALLVIAVRQGRPAFVRFGAGLAAVLGLTWSAAVVRQWGAVRSHVLEYAGSNERPQWGLVQLGHWLGDPGWVSRLTGDGRFVVVVLCAGVAAGLAWYRPARGIETVALALVAFLFLSPAFGSQYLAWAVAAAYLLDRAWATVFNLAAGAVLLETYTRWNGTVRWNYANQWGFDHVEVAALFGCWIVLAAVLIQGARALLGPPPRAVGSGAAEAAVVPAGRPPLHGVEHVAAVDDVALGDELADGLR
ncbi:MAG: glycosyltransferase 87 family protein, partial [Actinomycetota bacterium]|nr:glycosyltransferase 87 family protein [Actinomycetota bacterium]